MIDKLRNKLLLLPLLFIGISLLLSNTKKSEQSFCSLQSMVFDEANHCLYVADVTGKQIMCFDTQSNQISSTISLDETVGDICLHNNRLLVTTRSAQGELLQIDAGRHITNSIQLGHTPNAICCDEDKVVVINKYDNIVSVLNAQNLKLLTTFEHKARFPERAEMHEGKLYLMDLVPQGRADDIDVASHIHIYDVSTGNLLKRIELPSGSNAIKGSCFSEDKRYLYLTHVIGRFYIPAKTVKKGWMNTNALSIIDLESESLLASVLLDFPNRGCANPWGICTSLDGQELAITLSGTDELLLIDRVGMHLLIDKLRQRFSPELALEEMSNDLSFLTSVKRRIPLRGSKGVRAVLAVEEGYWASAYYSADLISVSDGGSQSYSLNENENTLERTGEIYFNDATYCLQNWQSCTSCHVDDGRVDGLNWDLLNDGIGNPKNTKSLLYAHQTPPSMALGVRKDATTSVKAGIKHSLFKKDVDEDVAKAVDAYVKSITPLPSPYLETNGKLTKAAKRGRKVFQKKGCAHCHSGEYYTNGQSYVFDIATGPDTLKAFDTPGLKELWRTAPYLYDGRATTLKEVLTIYRGTHFNVELSEMELDDLVLYLKSL